MLPGYVEFTVAYQNESKEIYRIKIAKGKVKKARKTEVIEEVNAWPVEKRKRAQRQWIQEAKTLWEDRKLDGNEGNYSKAVRLYEKAFYTIESYKPQKFDEEWREDHQNAEGILDQAKKELVRTLQTAEREFRVAYKTKKKDKALRKIEQIIKLIGDPNDLTQVKYQIYKEHLYR